LSVVEVGTKAKGFDTFGPIGPMAGKQGMKLLIPMS